jgi:hypothetical protein
MNAVASTLLNWSALSKIVLAALIGGAGGLIAFGFLLLSVEYARGADRRGHRVAHWGIAGLGCVGVAAVGIYAMMDKPRATSPPKPTTVPSSGRVQRAAS